ncbi:hypothetical protein Pcinc_026179 [Petrolisthes cinctipes]|uniref:Uncharacterized protein n=1 Tax=Petrolisthes cinctipes TaxID=88211 RepID=A0AAE1F904_PETCI|nr:hypothetical protein Pcinc_026179 [Petrolisthes cinctipes]
MEVTDLMSNPVIMVATAVIMVATPVIMVATPVAIMSPNLMVMATGIPGLQATDARMTTPAHPPVLHHPNNDIVHPLPFISKVPVPTLFWNKLALHLRWQCQLHTERSFF